MQSGFSLNWLGAANSTFFFKFKIRLCPPLRFLSFLIIHKICVQPVAASYITTVNFLLIAWGYGKSLEEKTFVVLLTSSEEKFSSC